MKKKQGMQNTESRKTSSIEKGSTEEKDGKEEFREPGFWETVKEALFGVWRPLDCIQVEVSSRCPGRCIYCPHTTLRDRWRSRNMEISTFSRLWPLMRRSARVHLQGWGEPLLNPAFFDMAVLARKAGCQVSTTTCGLCMNETIALRIIDSGIDIVAFSLAGADAESNRSRLGVDFDRVCEAVSTLQGVRQKHMAVHLEIHFAYLMLASNMEAVRGLPAVRMGLGFHYELPDSSADGTSCRENIGRTFFVSADGSISPCVYVNVPAEAADPRRRVFGNVLERDPLAIWESDEYRQFRESLASGRPDRACQSCPKRFMNRNSER